MVRVSQEYRIPGHHKGKHRPNGFDYNVVRFGRGRGSLNTFTGLCSVNTDVKLRAAYKMRGEPAVRLKRAGAPPPSYRPDNLTATCQKHCQYLSYDSY